MSTSLSNFLKEKGALYAAESVKNKAMIEEWQAAVEQLFNQLEEWLIAADQDGFIQRKRSEIEVSEPGLGRYCTSRLDLMAFGEWVGIIPKARKTVKTSSPEPTSSAIPATGRVDITDEIRRYVLYRFGYGGDSQWFLDDPDVLNRLPQRLTAERFEAAILSYFQ